jgi:hypothetical protein
VSFEFNYQHAMFGEFWITGRLCFVISKLAYLKALGKITGILENQ